MNFEIRHERLTALLSYSPEDGLFRWRVAKGNRAAAGRVAGSVGVYGYRTIRIDQRDYRAARLAWFYATGRWPATFIDHINGDRLDDRLSNLREASRAQNSANAKTKNRKHDAPKGAHFHAASGRWTSSIQTNKKTIYLGCFATKEQAAEAYACAAKQHHSEFARL